MDICAVEAVADNCRANGIDPEQFEMMIGNIISEKEIQDLTQRLQVADLLNRGEKYQSIEQATGASTATISRVNKCLVYGSGGYRTVLSRCAETEGKEEK